MPIIPFTPDESAPELVLVRTKEGRAQDAEQIRQDFIKSQRLTIILRASQEPSRKSPKDEH
jgi:hypothetical protein